MTADPVDLSGRRARCTCSTPPVPSSYDLAFFEYRGPGSRTATEICVCGYHRVAHEQEPSPNGAIRNVVRDGYCPSFRPRGSHQFDSYYDGCRGWD